MRQLESMNSEKYSGTPTNDDNGKKTVEVIRMDEEQIVVEIKVSKDFQNILHSLQRHPNDIFYH